MTQERKKFERELDKELMKKMKKMITVSSSLKKKLQC